MNECVKCGMSRDGQSARIYYGNKVSKMSQSYGTGKNATVITTTRYTVGGWEDVRICNRCTRIRSRESGIIHLLWSVPLAVFGIGGLGYGLVLLFSEGLQGGNPVVGLVFLLGCGWLGTTKVVDSMRRLVKPLNEISRSAVARPIVIRRQRARDFDTFWTQAEFEKLGLG